MKNTELVEKISNSLSEIHKGKFVVIEPDSGDYFVGESEIEAYNKAHKKFPSKQFIFKRIGFKHSYQVGAI
tara:strand:- start:1566 stop:1778 length:213 start_codon:yes stop_codon:yes gene_type:complete